MVFQAEGKGNQICFLVQAEGLVTIFCSPRGKNLIKIPFSSRGTERHDSKYTSLVEIVVHRFPSELGKNTDEKPYNV